MLKLGHKTWIGHKSTDFEDQEQEVRKEGRKEIYSSLAAN